MRNWDERSAVSTLNASGAEVKGKFIVVRNGLKGLATCSALDYLKNYCGYTVTLHTSKN